VDVIKLRVAIASTDRVPFNIYPWNRSLFSDSGSPAARLSMRFQGKALRSVCVLRSSMVSFAASILKTTRSQAANRMGVRVPKSLTNKTVLLWAKRYRSCPSFINAPLNWFIASCASIYPGLTGFCDHATVIKRTDEVQDGVDSMNAHPRSSRPAESSGCCGSIDEEISRINWPSWDNAPGQLSHRGHLSFQAIGLVHSLY